MKGHGKQEILEKNHPSTASSGTIPTCENPQANRSATAVPNVLQVLENGGNKGGGADAETLVYESGPVWYNGKRGTGLEGLRSGEVGGHIPAIPTLTPLIQQATLRGLEDILQTTARKSGTGDKGNAACPVRGGRRGRLPIDGAAFANYVRLTALSATNVSEHSRARGKGGWGQTKQHWPRHPIKYQPPAFDAHNFHHGAFSRPDQGDTPVVEMSRALGCPHTMRNSSRPGLYSLGLREFRSVCGNGLEATVELRMYSVSSPSAFEEDTSVNREFQEDWTQIYESEPCLWQVKCKEYHDRVKKEAYYTRLLVILKEVDTSTTKDNVIKKINNLWIMPRASRINVDSSDDSDDNKSATEIWNILLRAHKFASCAGEWKRKKDNCHTISTAEGQAMTGFESQTRAADSVLPSNRRRPVASGRGVCDCKYQVVECAVGKLDNWTRCRYVSAYSTWSIALRLQPTPVVLKADGDIKLHQHCLAHNHLADDNKTNMMSLARATDITDGGRHQYHLADDRRTNMETYRRRNKMAVYRHLIRQNDSMNWNFLETRWQKQNKMADASNMADSRSRSSTMVEPRLRLVDCNLSAKISSTEVDITDHGLNCSLRNVKACVGTARFRPNLTAAPVQFRHQVKGKGSGVMTFSAVFITPPFPPSRQTSSSGGSASLVKDDKSDPYVWMGCELLFSTSILRSYS
ncbi:hypothetical protein PR048_017541 [Dryococelus australis]|uniref:Uncharacterized protein n=1 Tax=Dryococelus australis TaxID=614101 RepID=A0ABQ9H9T6_9NEOP|nr:hypothetical protein PR048_017541 [Dryococelus australis]